MTDTSGTAPVLPRPIENAHRITSDEAAIAAAHLLAEVFAEDASQRDRDRQLPWAELDRYSASGLGAITVPREYGGADVSYVTLAEVFRILSVADPALGQIPQNHFGVLGVIRELATPAQKKRIYAQILAGQRLGNAGPERGTPTILHQTTTLSTEQGKLRLHGTRFYSTGALFAHWIPTRALDEQQRSVQVLVARDTPGVEVVDDWNGFGQRTTASGTVKFNQVAVDPDNVLPVWQLADRPGLSGPVSQLIHAAIDTGIARAAIDDTIRYVREKSRPWIDSGLERASDDPYTLHAIGRLQIDLHATEEILREAAAEIDTIAAAPITAESSARASVAVAHAKILSTEIALQASEKLFELAGSSATRAAPNLGRHWRNARVHTLHDPVRWKYHLLGNYELNGALPRRHQWN
ncbi:SfnB family sulfur acquisition oxidoreductase [Herbaspirillum sp. RTI4]|uniref:SfnB family sulfur acquisition oxidoreductase n=1 Tax=Herbaspirillum sp. RTI4 TaxID=3048640 RepID=UPI002AB5C581|nr:SfnB family sulfur acquisition oxidoreductase [Herbaspirillum sp. RTI4]MDY7578463.1 SfnB family sulfur acquisition oxidoreductase [Herbaspirillum sp. RTI4]MEA9981508.1 SfnB family sulfur acquisition oxidoreductase [Herbaspirillum sp. RTI4]